MNILMQMLEMKTQFMCSALDQINYALQFTPINEISEEVVEAIKLFECSQTDNVQTLIENLSSIGQVAPDLSEALAESFTALTHLITRK